MLHRGQYFQSNEARGYVECEGKSMDKTGGRPFDLGRSDLGWRRI